MGKLTTIQLKEETRKELEKRKLDKKESYDAVIKRMIDMEGVPTMEEMFKIADNTKMKKKYTTDEIVKMTHDIYEEEDDLYRH